MWPLQRAGSEWRSRGNAGSPASLLALPGFVEGYPSPLRISARPVTPQNHTSGPLSRRASSHARPLVGRSARPDVLLFPKQVLPPVQTHHRAVLAAGIGSKRTQTSAPKDVFSRTTSYRDDSLANSRLLQLQNAKKRPPMRPLTTSPCGWRSCLSSTAALFAASGMTAITTIRRAG